jgi:hypothetical protein
MDIKQFVRHQEKSKRQMNSHSTAGVVIFLATFEKVDDR